MDLSYAQKIVSISSAVWAQCTNITDRQTDKPWNGKIDRNRRIRFSVMSPKNFKYG